MASDYPEHERLAKIKDESQAIGGFLENNGKYTLCEWVDDDEGRPRLMPVGKSITTILAEYFEIDLAQLEREKRSMLEQMRGAAS